jgi:hypothetical protein
MTYPSQEQSDQIDSVHSTAIRQEIGEKLWSRLEREPVHLPPRLIALMARLRDETSNAERMKDFAHDRAAGRIVFDGVHTL